jgi:N-acetyl-gamma-glutamyl-phosphate reductase
MNKPIGVAILGGTGYGAGQLLHFLCRHPEAEIVSVVSSSRAGSAVSSSHPYLRGFCDFCFDQELNFSQLAKFEQQVVFAALPHGASSKAIAKLLPKADKQNTKIIDLSGDLRIRGEEARRQHYPDAQAGQALVDRFVYGLTELQSREICLAQCVANPGCLASGCVLAAAPLVAKFNVSCVYLDAKTGTSGAGRTPKAEFHHPEIHGNAWAYKVLEHRHEPEIQQALSDCAGSEICTAFVPHVIPAARGIYVTAYVSLSEPVATAQLLAVYREYYKECRFVRVLEEIPQLHNVLFSNFCDVSVVARGKQVVAVSALDNLVKGMVGQAIQNMNLMCGLPEETGLWQPAPGPA